MIIPIKPKHINTNVHHWFDAFDNSETEATAKIMVKYFQKKGDWCAFTKEDLDEFSKADFWFNRITTENGYLRKLDNGKMEVTHKFIAQCYLHYPEIEVTK